MTENTEILILALPRRMRTDAARLKNEFKALRGDMRHGVNRVVQDGERPKTGASRPARPT